MSNGQKTLNNKYAGGLRSTPNKRTVIPNRVRAAGAAWPLCACGGHDTSASGRSTAPLCGPETQAARWVTFLGRGLTRHRAQS
jgi:hypothetical protein